MSGGLKVKNKQTSIVFSSSAPHDKMIDEFLQRIVPAFEKDLKPARMIVEVYNENEFGENLSGESIFEIAENKFDEEKETTGLEYCWFYKINEYVVVIGVKQ